MFGALPWATWDQAAIAALLCGAIVAALRGRRPTRFTTAIIPAAREFAFICAIYSVWRLARMLPLVHDEGALERARSLARFQDMLHLPTEASVQQWVMGYDWLVRFSTIYYATVHVPALIIFMIWLWVRHRDHYKQWRTALALLTLFCLIIRFERVAPPRFLPELGFVDLSTRLGLSVYGPVGTGVSDQYAAMPSIHVAWAAVVSFGALAISRSPWRWLVFSHVFITIFVVAATGHHWWLDSIVAVALLGVGIVIDRYGRRWAQRPTRARADLEPELVAA